MRFPLAFSGVCGAAALRRAIHQPAMCSTSPSTPSASPEAPNPAAGPPPPAAAPNAISTTPTAGKNISNNAQPAFCTFCAGKLSTTVPAGDERARLVCTTCGRVAYENPKVVCATVAVSRDGTRVLLARRKIWPRVGYWGIPAGFLELGESTDSGAARECYEECYATMAKDVPSVLLAVYSVLPAKQIQLVYRSFLEESQVPFIRPGRESLETRLFEWKDIPWDELAFPTCEWALKHAQKTLQIDTPKTQLRSKLPDGSFVDTPVSLPS